MSDAEQYAGEVEVVDGMLQLPEKYARARQFVVRQRTITQDVRSGESIDQVGWRDDPDRGVNNEHLEADEVQLKVYGEPEETYRVVVRDE
jgi:hypothetical protein